MYKSTGVRFVDSFFVTTIRTRGWCTAYEQFFLHPSSHRHSRTSGFKPQISDPVIMIPCHINDNHWVAVVRRNMNWNISFWYSDDFNSASTFDSVKALLTNTSLEFAPPNATWIQCRSYTYHPHSNECGPRTLLALIAMALHHSPHADMLLPLMDPNLSQISRWWVAKTIA